MEFAIQREIPGRLRLKLAGPVPEEDVGPFSALVEECPDIVSSQVYPRIGVLAVVYRQSDEARSHVLEHLGGIGRADIERIRTTSPYSPSVRTRGLLLDIAWLVGTYLVRRWILPNPIAMAVNVVRFVPFFRRAAHSLACGRLDVPVLDASAIAMSLVQLDAKTAGETMFLLDLGETLEDYTEARSQGALIDALLNVGDTAQLVQGDVEVQVGVSDLRQGDLIAVRTGMPVVVDGLVESGLAMVNQASLTGEPLAVERTVGDDVFAGTSVEEGEILVRVKADPGQTRLRSIVSLVQSADQYQSVRQKRREQLASRIVPWNFLLAGIVAITSRSIVKTSAALMVDYSCGLKLTGSIAVLSAMSQSAQAGFTVKGSKYFDAVRDADTIVFDKTGTLTEATPRVAKIIGSKDWPQREVLRFAACLEEHFPHPVARAVVNAATERGLEHRELHGDVEYLVAHGIVSTLEDKRVVIGSKHFVVEDEHVEVTARQEARIARELEGLSPLYLAVDGKLVGVLGIEDPLKSGVAEAVQQLRDLGFSRIVMLTGDNERTAARIAEEAGLAEFRANQLPEDKHAFVDELKAQGCNVIVVGDGVNDAPALARADVGIAMGQGTAIAKEVADITLSDGDLSSIVSLVKLANGLSDRMDRSFYQVMGLNSAFLAAGIAGIVTPQTSSLLHNATTIGLSLAASRPYKIG
ncbi:MAG: heavy metal translocating P-type ATPase [Eggerthellaceae bacterium]|nr:heavy metal translocating P-type ATPase [Eggerthellaceae bacterium]